METYIPWKDSTHRRKCQNKAPQFIQIIYLDVKTQMKNRQFLETSSVQTDLGINKIGWFIGADLGHLL